MRSEKPLLHDDITSSIIDSFFDVHRELGFGFREYLYTRALQRLLIAKGHEVEREVPVMVYFEVGLVLHFGKKARFYRIFFENRFKQRNR